MSDLRFCPFYREGGGFGRKIRVQEVCTYRYTTLVYRWYINQPYSTFHDDRSLEFFYGFLSVPEDFPM